MSTPTNLSAASMNEFWRDWTTFTKRPDPSPLTLLPNEIWLRIFLLAACDRTGTPHPRYLHTICSVCHHWRITCTTYPPLWNVIPYSMHWVFGDCPQRKLKAGISRTRVYIARSKTLPLTINLHVNEWAWGRNLDLAHEFLQILVAECHRWETVHFYIPGEAFDLLAPIRGHLAILRKLEIETAASGWPDSRRWQVDCFSDAPALRELRLDLLNFCCEGDYRVKLALPRMAQLERYDAPGYQGEPYQQLINNPSSHLRSLACPNVTPVLVPRTSPLTLLYLESLDLSGVEEMTSPSYLDTLTLPALKFLKLGPRSARGRPPPNQSSSFMAFIRRSGCSLSHLSMNGADFKGHLGDVFALCDDLAQLGLNWDLDVQLLEYSVLDPQSAFPVLPKLERVYFHYSLDKLNHEEALGRMVRSRTTDLVHTRAPEIQHHGLSLQPLKSVRFLGSSFMSSQPPLVELLAERDEEDVFLGALSSRVGVVLRHHYHFFNTAYAAINVELHVEMDGVLRELGNLEFGQGRNCRALLWRGIPNILRVIGKKRSQITMGERIYRVQSRAANLVKKWRPFLIRDVRTSPFSWSHDDKHETIGLMYNYDWEGIDAEDDIWDEIFGIAPWSYWRDAMG